MAGLEGCCWFTTSSFFSAGTQQPGFRGFKPEGVMCVEVGAVQPGGAPTKRRQGGHIQPLTWGWRQGNVCCHGAKIQRP